MEDPKQLIEECKKHLRDTKKYQHEYKTDIRKLITALERALIIGGVSSSTECDDDGYFYCPKCENKQIASETNDEALCNNCQEDMEFHSFDGRF